MTRSEFDTVDEMIRALEHSDRAAILFEDQSFSWREAVQAAATRAALAMDTKRPGPFHIGFLFENIPELCLWLAAGAVSGATMVGINPTRQGAELARDITYTDCQLIVTEPRFVEMLRGLDLGLSDDRILVVDTPQYADALKPYETASLPAAAVDPSVTALLLFTSGTSGAPKAVITSQGKWARTGRTISMTQNLTELDVGYMAMPMFHSNALFAGFSPVVYVGGALALRRRFSASGFLPDIRKFKATYFNYVGKPLTYILATPESPDDKDHTLRSVFGNEGAERDLRRFSDRFGVPVQDNYGSTESGASVQRVPEQPKGALGRGPEGTVVLDAETLEEKPPAEFDDNGRLLNPDECIGEIVNKSNASSFEGYYKNEEANAQRSRNGWYWSGDLGYRDKDGWFYFAGRDYEWLRVDGENFAAAPIERIVASYPGRHPRRRLRRARRRSGRPGHGGTASRRSVGVRRGQVRRVPSQPERSGHQVVASLCARRDRAALDRDVQGDQATTAGAAVGVRRPGVLPPEEGRGVAPADAGRHREHSRRVRGARSFGRTRQGLSRGSTHRAPAGATACAIDRPRRARCCGPLPNVFSNCFTQRK